MLDREIIFTSLIGFKNYGFVLDNQEVNYYHAYILPEIGDFYDDYVFTYLIMIDDKVCHCYDIRYLIGSLLSGNFKHLEALFSDNIDLVADFKDINFLFEHKNEIARMNLKGLYEYLNKSINHQMILFKNKQLYDEHKASLVYNLMCFAEDFVATDFSDFKGAIVRTSWEKKIMLDIYGKKMNYEEVMHTLQELYEDRFKELEHDYKLAHEDNKKLADEIKYEVLKTIYKFIN